MTIGPVATSPVATSSAATSTAATSNVSSTTGVPADAGTGPDTDVRDGSRQLRDIEELVAKLAMVTKQLAFPARTMPSPRPADAQGQQSAQDN